MGRGSFQRGTARTAAPGLATRGRAPLKSVDPAPLNAARTRRAAEATGPQQTSCGRGRTRRCRAVRLFDSGRRGPPMQLSKSRRFLRARFTEPSRRSSRASRIQDQPVIWCAPVSRWFAVSGDDHPVEVHLQKTSCCRVRGSQQGLTSGLLRAVDLRRRAPCWQGASGTNVGRSPVSTGLRNARTARGWSQERLIREIE